MTRSKGARQFVDFEGQRATRQPAAFSRRDRLGDRPAWPDAASCSWQR